MLMFGYAHAGPTSAFKLWLSVGYELFSTFSASVILIDSV